MTYLWNQLALCDLEWTNKVDASQYIAHRDSMRLVEFLMAIQDEFENTQASLLHRSLLPSLEDALSELVLEETQFSTIKLHTFEMIMAIASRNTCAPSSYSVSLLSKIWHRYSECRKRLSRGNH